MKNIITAVLVAATVLSLASCGDGDKAKKGPDSTSTTVIDSNTRSTAVIDSTKHDTVTKVVAQKTPVKSSGGGALSNTSLQSVKDSIKKDSARLSRK